jgi:hypothetical protein
MFENYAERAARARELLESVGCINLKGAGDLSVSLSAVYGETLQGKIISVNLVGPTASIRCLQCGTMLHWFSNKLRCLKCTPLETFTVRWTAEFLIAVKADCEAEAIRKVNLMDYDDFRHNQEVMHENHTTEIVK